MSSIWVRAWRSTPRIDCGLCGLSTCASYARAVLVGDTKIETCPVLSLPEFSSLQTELTASAERIRPPKDTKAPDKPKGGIVFTQPCKDANSRYMAELRVFSGIEPGSEVRFPVFDPSILCDMMECLKERFQDVKCSRELGYGRADDGDLNITMLQDGRINMRRVNSKEHVESLFAILERTIIAATVCNCCGRDMLSVLSACESGTDRHMHTIFNAGTTFSLDSTVAKRPITKSALLSTFGDDAVAGVRIVEMLQDHIQWQIEALATGESLDEERKPDLQRTKCAFAELFQSPSANGNETLILKGLALVWALEGAILGLESAAHHMSSLSVADSATARELLKAASNGQIPERMDRSWSSGLKLCYAHFTRLNRASCLLNKWS
ncbi:MAG: hypothetical protein HXY34_07185 [Candidatus Thorarchaeota archaeon]|nr:hypothetical protein [Candidatus Thorarchaeota archaeon]